MPIIDSRVKKGSLKLGATGLGQKDFSCQPTAITIEPSYNTDGDPLEVLCGDTILPSTTRTDALKFTAIQDFDDPQGLVAYSWNNDMEPVPFEWKPSGATGPTYTGTVEVRALTVGGDIAKRITTDAEWTIAGKATYTPPPPIPPTKPTITEPAAAATVTVKKPPVKGVADKSVQVRLYEQSAMTVPLASATADASTGAYTLTPTADLTNKSYTVIVRAGTDASYTDSDPRTFTVDAS